MNDIAFPNYDNVLTEHKLKADDEEISQVGIKSAGNATRYSKVTDAQYQRWTRPSRPPDHDYFCNEHGRYNYYLTSTFLRNPETCIYTVCVHAHL